MVGRWSRFAIGVNGSSINLHAYCQQDYAQEEYKRSFPKLQFMDDSFLLIGHGGEIFAEAFQVCMFPACLLVWELLAMVVFGAFSFISIVSLVYYVRHRVDTGVLS